MELRKPLSTRTKWAIVLAAAGSHPLLLYTLHSTVGEAVNTVVLVGPVAATLVFGIRVGLIFIALNSLIAALMFRSLTHMGQEGLPKAAVSVLVTTCVCVGADRLRRFIEQRKAIEEALRQAQKMEAIGRLAGGVAHDINNTLNAIMGSAVALRHELAVCGRPFPDLDSIALACDRGAQLTRNLLGFARKNCSQEERLSLNAVVQSVQALIGRTMHKNVRFETRLAEPAPFMVGDQGQLENAVMNLCLNALDAMVDKGTLTIATRSDGGRVSVCVSDTGTGMDDHVREHAFEPFFTTKPRGKGTGMGLAMVYGTVHAMHGDIKLESALGKGTRITMTFPRAPAAAPDAPPAVVPIAGTLPVAVARPGAPLVAPGPGTEAARVPPPEDDLGFLRDRTVLLIDDEPLVLRAGERLLRVLGCQVLGAKSGREGIDVFKAQGSLVSLVIVDLMMPDMDGVATVDEILGIAPQTPVLLASGYTEENGRLAALLDRRPTVGFLGKPYNVKQLTAAARDLLGPHTNADASPESEPRRSQRLGLQP